MVGNFNCFLNATISTSFLFTRNYVSFTSLGLYPSLITKSLIDFILVSLAKDKILSKFSHNYVLFNDTRNLEDDMATLVSVE